MRRTKTYWDEVLLENEIRTNIRFDKNMETVYDLSYFLIDFQAVVNNLTDVICNQGEVRRKHISQYEKELFRNQDINYIDDSHPEWQKQIERNVKSYLFEPDRAVADREPSVIIGLKQTTRRAFNRKYRMNMQLNGFFKRFISIRHSQFSFSWYYCRIYQRVIGKENGE